MNEISFDFDYALLALNRNLCQYRKYCDNKKVINHKHTLFKKENVAYNAVNDDSVYYGSR